jgi:hypothetical protein
MWEMCEHVQWRITMHAIKVYLGVEVWHHLVFRSTSHVSKASASRSDWFISRWSKSYCLSNWWVGGCWMGPRTAVDNLQRGKAFKNGIISKTQISKRNKQYWELSIASGSPCLTPQLRNCTSDADRAGGRLSLQPGSEYQTTLSPSRFPFRSVFTYVTGEGRNLQRPPNYERWLQYRLNFQSVTHMTAIRDKKMMFPEAVAVQSRSEHFLCCATSKLSRGCNDCSYLYRAS